jgi:hypothetical protein
VEIYFYITLKQQCLRKAGIAEFSSNRQLDITLNQIHRIRVVLQADRIDHAVLYTGQARILAHDFVSLGTNGRQA